MEFVVENLSNIRIKLLSKIRTDRYYDFLELNILKWNTKIGEFDLEITFDKNGDNNYKLSDGNFDLAIYGFEIDEEYRSKGIGKFSFGKIIEYIDKNFSKYRNIHLSVFSNNIPAIKIYEHYGFKIIEDDGEITNMLKISNI